MPICPHQKFKRCPSCNSKYMKEWRSKHLNSVRKTASKSNWFKRKKVIMMLGGKCEKCGITDLRILEINHLNGRGTEELKNPSPFYNAIYEKRRGTKDLNILCANCNVLYEYEVGRRTDWTREFQEEVLKIWKL